MDNGTMPSRRVIRASFVAIMLLSLLVPVASFVGSTSGNADFRGETQADIRADDQKQYVPPRENVTVVATDSNSWLGERSDGPRARAELVAFNPNGTIRYYNDSHTRYWDVDPVPNTTASVEYMYADHLPAEECPDFSSEAYMERAGIENETRWQSYVQAHNGTDACTRNGFERVNLTTGNVSKIYSVTTPGKEATRYHDADRIGENRLLVADIAYDRVFIRNTKTNEITWQWSAHEQYDPRTTGGRYPEDWTHINDVEMLDDGRVMVSVRNHDEVLFIRPGQGVQENWTLGLDDRTDVLYEQHNPDYIPKSQGGPAVLVADSENNRVIEYQREGGEWNASWTWQDARLQWPRDADRLPNGHTLITDSNGNRVLEVNKAGKIVWSARIAFPYEAERLGTGDESAGGESAQRAGLASRQNGPVERTLIGLKDLVPGKYLNGLMYTTPVWIGFVELLALVAGALTATVWALSELYWRRADGRPSLAVLVRKRIE